MTTRLPAFEVLVDMARNDPEGLETLRRSLTSAVIDGASSARSRRRLEGIQFKVDVARRRAATPLAATIRISEMMARSLADLHASLVTAHEEPALAGSNQDRGGWPGAGKSRSAIDAARHPISAGTLNVIPFPRGGRRSP